MSFVKDFNLKEVIEFDDDLLRSNQGAQSIGKCKGCNHHANLYNGVCERCEDENECGDDFANERIFMSHLSMSRGLTEDERSIYNL